MFDWDPYYYANVYIATMYLSKKHTVYYKSFEEEKVLQFLWIDW